MSLFAIVLAFLLEQVRPLPYDSQAHGALAGWARWVDRNANAGTPAHGWLVWAVVVALPTLAVGVVHGLLLHYVGWPLAMLWSVALLYLTLGFRQFSHHFTRIRDALAAGDEEGARQLLMRWQGVDASRVPRSELVRHVIEYSVLAAHRHVFGVLAWYCLLSVLGAGPAGAVLYRNAAFAAGFFHRRHRRSGLPGRSAAQQVAERVWHALDWLPARLTAIGFAVVGSFEEAIDSWRRYAAQFPDDNDGVILAATAGAINVRLGGAALRAASGHTPSTLSVTPPADAAGPEAGATTAPNGIGTGTDGREADAAYLPQVVGLVWRSVVMWLLLIVLLSLARLLG